LRMPAALSAVRAYAKQKKQLQAQGHK